MLSLRPHLAFPFPGWGHSNGGPLGSARWDAAPAGRPATRWRSPWLTAIFWPQADTDRLTDWLKTLRISRGHLDISFHNAYHFHLTTWLLPFIYTGASGVEGSLIEGTVKGQYATFWVVSTHVKIWDDLNQNWTSY